MTAPPTLIRVPLWYGWFALAVLLTLVLVGRSRGADPLPKEEVYTVEVEAKETGDVLTWTWTGNGRSVTFTWTLLDKGKATEELAATLVKTKLCEAGRCPLRPVRVKLVPRKVFD